MIICISEHSVETDILKPGGPQAPTLLLSSGQVRSEASSLARYLVGSSPPLIRSSVDEVFRSPLQHLQEFENLGIGVVRPFCHLVLRVHL